MNPNDESLSDQSSLMHTLTLTRNALPLLGTRAGDTDAYFITSHKAHLNAVDLLKDTMFGN